ncbi:MAG: 50S ribosomal protein L3 [Chitinophagaceae bacterium]|nr:MAG: 50S ribosomal protein L3 [Chitinophagaceae bacterium]
MKGIIGRKIGMTQYFRPDGTHVACTIIEAGPCKVIQKKTVETDGYDSVQIGYGVRKESRTTNAQKGHFKKHNSDSMQVVREIRDFDLEKESGDEITIEIFAEGDRVSVEGVSKGKGFQGVVKRHGFAGVGMATHGQHNRERAPGSLGAGSYPSRVFKGMRMAGRMGSDKITLKKVPVEKVIAEKNIIYIKGAVPGRKGSIVMIKKN